jgi:hypothetical protein
MAESIAFGTLLVDRIGLTVATCGAIQDQGVTTLTELSELDYDDIKNMVLNIMKYIAPGTPDVRVPYTSLKRLYAAKYWFALCTRCGLPTLAAGLTNASLSSKKRSGREESRHKGPRTYQASEVGQL